jgi:hypothetical protein
MKIARSLLLPLAVRAFQPASLPRQATVMTSLKSRLDPAEGAVEHKQHLEKYKHIIEDLAVLMESTADNIALMKKMVGELEKLEIDDPSVTKLGKVSHDLAMALAEAKAADEVCGPNSEEASKAWAIAEGVSKGEEFTPPSPSYRMNAKAQNAHHMYSAVVDPQSLEEAKDALGKIEHLTRLMTLEKNRVARHGLAP